MEGCIGAFPREEAPSSELWEKLDRLLRGTQKKKKRQRGPWDKRLGQRQERNEPVRGLIEKATEHVGL